MADMNSTNDEKFFILSQIDYLRRYTIPMHLHEAVNNDTWERLISAINGCHIELMPAIRKEIIKEITNRFEDLEWE